MTIFTCYFYLKRRKRWLNSTTFITKWRCLFIRLWYEVTRLKMLKNILENIKYKKKLIVAVVFFTNVIDNLLICSIGKFIIPVTYRLAVWAQVDVCSLATYVLPFHLFTRWDGLQVRTTFLYISVRPTYVVPFTFFLPLFDVGTLVLHITCCRYGQSVLSNSHGYLQQILWGLYLFSYISSIYIL